ncbi:MAG: hypothetical protein HQK79_17725 [Desulfobacterales bacterium]|nr:hypothetical protein [Desulfobacterales bacterium]
MDEYINIKEASRRINYKPQSIYNMIAKKVFIINKHYFKPTPKKLLFKYSALQEWIEQSNSIISSNVEQISEYQSKSCINI